MKNTETESTTLQPEAGTKPDGRKGRIPSKVVARARWESRFWKLSRLMGYCTVVGIAGLGLAVSSAYGDAKEGALALGSELGHLDAVGNGKPLMLNGQPIHFSSTVQSASVTEVLDRAEAYCEDNPVGLKDTLENLPDLALKEIPEAVRHAESEAIREDGIGKGMVTCLVDQDGSHAGKSLFERLSEFAETGDMSAVGDMRYIYAEMNPGGSTHIIAVWTNGPFNLYAFAPEGDQDTPGFDPPEAARPIDSTRLLTASAEGMPYGTWVYRSKADGEHLFVTMDTDMKAQGWTLLAGDAEDHHRRIYQQGERDLYVTGVKHKGNLVISMVEMGSR